MEEGGYFRADEVALCEGLGGQAEIGWWDGSAACVRERCAWRRSSRRRLEEYSLRVIALQRSTELQGVRRFGCIVSVIEITHLPSGNHCLFLRHPQIAAKLNSVRPSLASLPSPIPPLHNTLSLQYYLAV